MAVFLNQCVGIFVDEKRTILDERESFKDIFILQCAILRDVLFWNILCHDHHLKCRPSSHVIALYSHYVKSFYWLNDVHKCIMRIKWFSYEMAQMSRIKLKIIARFGSLLFFFSRSCLVSSLYNTWWGWICWRIFIACVLSRAKIAPYAHTHKKENEAESLERHMRRKKAAVTFAMGVLFQYRFTKIHLMRRHKFSNWFYMDEVVSCAENRCKMNEPTAGREWAKNKNLSRNAAVPHVLAECPYTYTYTILDEFSNSHSSKWFQSIWWKRTNAIYQNSIKMIQCFMWLPSNRSRHPTKSKRFAHRK